jgi:hypothetical protein
MAIVIGLPSAAAAQAAPAGTVAGVTAGLNLATVTQGDGDDLRRLAGVTAGVFAHRPIGSRAGVLVEALYSQRGTKADGGDLAVHLDFVDVPALVTLSSANRAVWIGSGPQLGVKVRAAAGPTGGDLETLDDVRRLDLGWAAGAGVVAGRVTFDARYVFGLRDMDAIDRLGHRIANRTFTVKAGVRLK